jgi:deoxyhypusine synthase
VPGWEDSTLGNIFVSHVLSGDLPGYAPIKSGLETMGALAEWYVRTTMGRGLAELAEVGAPGEDAVALRAIPPERAERTVGFFQIGGGIAGDFRSAWCR